MIIVLIIIMYKKQVMHNAIAHHPLTDAQPIPEQPAPPPRPATPIYCLAWRQMVWNIHLASLGQLSWVCPLPAPAAPPACSLAGQSEKPKSPWPGVNTALQQLKHQHVISALLILIQNIAPYQLLGGKLTLSWLEPGQIVWFSTYLLKFNSKGTQGDKGNPQPLLACSQPMGSTS